jgi:Acetyltransferase (GNAT) domain
LSIEIIPFANTYEGLWDDFCSSSVNATFLHTRRFLSYHQDRFKDLSVLVFESGKLIGIFPAAQSPSDSSLVISHPGITYGGLVHQGSLRGKRMIEVLSTLSAFYLKNGYQRLQYKVIPYIYSKSPSQDDLYALFRMGALRTRCDLSCAIDLANPPLLSERRRRGLKKAQKVITLSNNLDLLGELWSVVEENLARKHDAKPVHSLAEMILLSQRFPEQIILRCGLMEGRVVAGVVFFNANNVWHAQYIAASLVGYEQSALDAVFISAIEEARSLGTRYFDFGTSNEEQGKVLNEGLYTFKSEFGAGGVAHEFYEWDFQK